MIKHASLFSGIGGFDLAASWMGWDNKFQVEIDPFCQKILAKNFQSALRYSNIKEFDGTKYRGTIDVLSAGPPCQPASQGGKRKGEDDDRWLWPEAIRVFGEIRPRIGLFENPDDLLTLANGESFERICCALEDFGYKVETFGIPAACVGAWHERDRIWIIAYANDFSDKGELDNRTAAGQAKRSKRKNAQKGEALDRQRIRPEPNSKTEAIPDINSQGLSKPTQTKFTGFYQTNGTPQGCSADRTLTEIGRYWQTEPGVGRMVHGLPHRVDRIKGLGNAVVPQVAFEIFKVIEFYLTQIL